MFLKIIIEFLAVQHKICIWEINGLPLLYFLLPWASSVTLLINILLTWGARGEWPGGKEATWWALQSLEHLLSMDFKALNPVWWSCELRSALLLGCELVIGLQYIIGKYNPWAILLTPGSIFTSRDDTWALADRGLGADG